MKDLLRGLISSAGLTDGRDPKTALASSVLYSFIITSILWSVLFVSVFLPLFIANKFLGSLFAVLLLAVSLISLFLMRLDRLRSACWVFVAGAWLLATIYVVLNGGLPSQGMIFFVTLIVGSVWMLGQRAALIAAGLFLIMTLLLAILEQSGIHPPNFLPGPPLARWSIFLLTGGMATVPLIRVFAAFADSLVLTQKRAHEVQFLHQELRESEERLRTIVEAAPDAIFILNMAGRIVEVNEAALRQLGYSREELLQFSVGDFVASEFRARAQSRFPALEGGIFYESRHVRKDGSEVPVELNTRKIVYGGEPALLGIARDISERKRGEEQRSQLERQLQQAQKLESVGRLAGGVAHDFNNLLTVIDGYGALISTQLDPGSPLQPYAEEIRKAAGMAATLTRQLLAFSRKQAVEFKPTDLNRVVEDTVKMLERLVGADVELVLRLQTSLGSILADSGQLQQVLLNLAVNASDAMPNGGRIVIQTAEVRIDAGADSGFPTAPAGRYVELALSDTGIGMDAETQRKIFEPFFTTKGPARGTGLGLSTVYGIVQHSHGRISVYSEPGKGTAFRLIFPRIEAAPAAEQPLAPPAHARSGDNAILVVEDRQEVRRLITSVLELDGYKVLECATGEEALLLTKTCGEAIDLVLTDIVMPGISGVELVETMRQTRPELRVLFTSGYLDDALAGRGIENLGAAFLAKPFTPDSLAAKVREVLAAQSGPHQP